MARRRVFDQQLYAHFVTFSCYRRRRWLDHDQPKRMLLGALNQQLRRLSSTCVGFVLMPDHLHAIVWFPEPGRLSTFVQEWKRQSSLAIRGWFKQQASEYARGLDLSEALWQRRYYSFEIYSDEKLRGKVEYMHLNPVRAGLVKRAVDWRWSSARHYEEGRTVGVPIGWIW